jgi:hypothetical protein
VYNSYEPIDYSKALEEGSAGLNAYIEASIQCVQHADNSKLHLSSCKVCNEQNPPHEFHVSLGLMCLSMCEVEVCFGMHGFTPIR